MSRGRDVAIIAAKQNVAALVPVQTVVQAIQPIGGVDLRLAATAALCWVADEAVVLGQVRVLLRVLVVVVLLLLPLVVVVGVVGMLVGVVALVLDSLCCQATRACALRPVLLLLMSDMVQRGLAAPEGRRSSVCCVGVAWVMVLRVVLLQALHQFEQRHHWCRTVGRGPEDLGGVVAARVAPGNVVMLVALMLLLLLLPSPVVKLKMLLHQNVAAASGVRASANSVRR
jgi:hypothetical protein